VTAAGCRKDKYEAPGKNLAFPDNLISTQKIILPSPPSWKLTRSPERVVSPFGNPNPPMKSYSFLRPALLAAGILTLGAATTFGQAAAGGRGGGGTGTAGLALPMPAGGLPSEALQPTPLNDMEVTEITRVKLQGVISTATKAVADARAELTKAIFTAPQTVAAKVQALANAEQTLAGARADAFATVLKGYKDITPEKKRAIIANLGGAAAGGRGGG
jgi:hypothetical protein